MDLIALQKAFVDVRTKNFGVPWPPEQRMLAMVRQIGDASGALQKAQGKLKTDQHGYDDLRHRVASILPDLFFLADQLGVDWEKELIRCMDWFEGKPSS